MIKISIQLFINLFILSSTFCQKNINTQIKFPSNSTIKSLKVLFDNGKEEKIIDLELKENKVFLDNLFFSEFGSLKINYSLNNGISGNDLIFINEKPSIIEYYQPDLDTAKINYRLDNAFDFSGPKNKFLDYTKKETSDCREFLEKYSDSIFNNKPIIDSIYNYKFSNLSKKELEYISFNNKDYYVKWYFRRNLLKGNLLDIKLVESVFNKFSTDFRNSDEGLFIKDYLNSFSSFNIGNELPYFRVKDINNKYISISDYKNKTNVLLVFWATWCVPCVKEIPKIKEIKNKYGDDLSIIFISYDTNKEFFLKKIKEYQMDWVHIFNDIDLINSYGSYKAIPRIYLVNKQSKLIYDRDQNHDIDLSMLDSALLKLYQ